MLSKHKRVYIETNEDVDHGSEPRICYIYTLQSLFEQNIGFNYIDCEGLPQKVVLNNSSTDVCALGVDIPANPSNQWEIFIGIECGELE